jgi:hypothetical protein
VPRFADLSRPWVLERLVLQALGRQSHARAVREQSRAIGRHEVRHGPALPNVAMEPETTVHSVDHSLPARRELPEDRLILDYHALLGLQPVVSDADVDDEWNGQRRGTLHLLANEAG